MSVGLAVGGHECASIIDVLIFCLCMDINVCIIVGALVINVALNYLS
uniref:Uncharacterized protein n=1 Tax=Anguilla anguilla TaxID=7936 RepID=A0A0E9S7D8_ANGAN